MLVTCPECGARISEEADPCPRCGLPHAGRRSKEFNEGYVQRKKERVEELKDMDMVRCTSCDWVGRPHSKPVRIEVAELRGAGYGVGYHFRCPKCGSLAYRVIVYD